MTFELFYENDFIAVYADLSALLERVVQKGWVRRYHFHVLADDGAYIGRYDYHPAVGWCISGYAQNGIDLLQQNGVTESQIWEGVA